MSNSATVWLVLPWSPEHQGGVTGVVREIMRFWPAHAQLARPTLVVDDWAAVKPRPQQGYVRRRLRALASHSTWGALRSLVQAPRTLLHTLAALRAERVVAVNFHYTDTAPFGVALLKRLGLYRGRLVISFHGTEVRPARHWTEGLLRRLCYRWADSLVACSPSLAERMVSTLRCRPEHIQVIPNGVDTDLFHADAPPPRGIKLPQRYLVSLGSYIERKAHADLLRGFARIAMEQADLHLCIAGAKGRLFGDTEALVADLGLAGRVHLLHGLGPEAVAGLLSGAQACVQPALAESMPLAVLEAAAAGVPVLATAIPGHIGLVEEGVTGWLFRPADAGDCAAAMSRALSDPTAARDRAARLQAKVASDYTWGRCVDRYHRLFGLQA